MIEGSIYPLGSSLSQMYEKELQERGQPAGSIFTQQSLNTTAFEIRGSDHHDAFLEKAIQEGSQAKVLFIKYRLNAANVYGPLAVVMADCFQNPTTQNPDK
jgi:ABC-type phosphate transport system auxiliary subunit